MSIHQDARAIVFVADYVGVDSAGKISAIGAAFAIGGVTPTGFVAPQHVAAVIDVPSKYVGQELALSLELRDVLAGQAVQVPGPTGQLEALRLQQIMRVQALTAEGVYVPQEMFCRLQLAVAFVNGIPLTPGRFYAWRLEIDGNHQPGWEAHFYVPGPPPPPVFGGPAGRADLPRLP